ncbi:MAG: hypothetical protein P1U56_03190 [Saprospiraceae bacterium]|nr:hypothetical protein [Saprospiraceae bacterium]
MILSWNPRNSFVLVVVLIGMLSLVSCENRENLIQFIAEKNVYECQHIGLAGGESQVFKAFEKVKAKATDEDLIRLTEHDSLAVAMYASLAVIEGELLEPVDLFKKYVQDSRVISGFCGCQIMNSTVIEKIYFAYLYKLRFEPGENEFPVTDRGEPESITKIDSLILHANVEHQFLLGVVLEKEKEYSESDINAIKRWAFEYQNIHALEYIFENYRDDNEEELEKSLKVLRKQKEMVKNSLYNVNLYVVNKMIEDLEKTE